MKLDKQKGVGKIQGSLRTKGPSAFVGCCDGITFGVEDGQAFHTGKSDWSREHMARWADANALFYQAVADKLRAFSAAVKTGRA